MVRKTTVRRVGRHRDLTYPFDTTAVRHQLCKRALRLLTRAESGEEFAFAETQFPNDARNGLLSMLCAFWKTRALTEALISLIDTGWEGESACSTLTELSTAFLHLQSVPQHTFNSIFSCSRSLNNLALSCRILPRSHT